MAMQTFTGQGLAAVALKLTSRITHTLAFPSPTSGDERDIYMPIAGRIVASLVGHQQGGTNVAYEISIRTTRNAAVNADNKVADFDVKSNSDGTATGTFLNSEIAAGSWVVVKVNSQTGDPSFSSLAITIETE